MIVTKKIVEAHRLINLLIETAQKNNRFKQRLIKDPIKTIEKVTGKPSHFPEGIRIQVEDQSDTSIVFLNLPINPRRQLKTHV